MENEENNTPRKISKKEAARRMKVLKLAKARVLERSANGFTRAVQGNSIGSQRAARG